MYIFSFQCYWWNFHSNLVEVLIFLCSTEIHRISVSKWNRLQGFTFFKAVLTVIWFYHLFRGGYLTVLFLRCYFSCSGTKRNDSVLLLAHFIILSVIDNNDRKLQSSEREAKGRKKKKLTVRCNACVLITVDILKNCEINVFFLQGVVVTANLIRSLTH